MKPSTAKSKGRDTENRVIAYLRSWGLKVERRRLAGIHDQGDVAGWNTDQGSVCVEIKTASTWTPMRWLAELDVEADNCAAETGFVVARPKGLPDPDDYVVLIRFPWFMDLMREAGYIPPTETTAVLDRALADLRARAVIKRGETVAISDELLRDSGPTVTEIAERHGVTFRGVDMFKPKEPA